MEPCIVFVPGVVLKSANVSLAAASMKARMSQADVARKQRTDVTLMLRSKCGMHPPEPPLVITVTRHSPGKLDGHDNLPLSAKHVVDAIAGWLKLDDAHPGLTWKYDQQKGDYGVGICIEKKNGIVANEQLADWSRWMRYLFSRSVENDDGSVTIPSDMVLRWKRQANTSYADLYESQKKSDRAEAVIIQKIFFGEEDDDKR